VSAASVERFWRPRGGAFAGDDGGFLRDPDAAWLGTQWANLGVLRSGALRDHRCLVLLGEPGAGKSTAAANTDQLVPGGVTVLPFDLAAYGAEERLVRDVFEGPTIGAWSAGTGELCLILDSLDEAQARVPHVGAILASRVRRLPCARLFLRIACRTADWPAGLEQSLTGAFGEVAVVEILPLRRADVAAIAANWCDPSQFLDEVAQAGAEPLAARPLTLRFLARGFAASGTLPERGASLYAAGVRSLCEEQNVARRDAGLEGVLSLDQRVAVARRLAAATVFGGARAVWTGPEVDVGGADIAVARLAGSAEPTSDGSVGVSVAAVREAARTGLFTSRGDQRLGWAHATFADFLAAEWVVANGLAAAQATPLFLGPDGRCWPQARLAAAWAVAISPERFGFLTAADPAAFQGEVELPGDTLRAAVIDGLFSVAGTLTAARWECSYRALRHRDVADQLRPHLRDPDEDRRGLALHLASECATVELHDDLVAITFDTTVETQDRVNAGWVLAQLRDPYRTAALRPLALDAAARGDDSGDELKGVALLASWPQAVSNAEVFAMLTPRRQRNHRGFYAMFIDRFRATIGAADVEAGLQWLLADLNGPVDDHTTGSLANRVLELAATKPTDDSVVDAFTIVVLARVEHDNGLLFEEFSDDVGDPLADATMRRAVAAAVLAMDPTDRVLHRLSGHSSRSLGVVRADDLGWLADLYAASGSELRRALRRLFDWTFDLRVAEHRHLVLDMDRDHPLYVDLVHTLVDAVPLDSPEAEQMRQSWDVGSDPVNEQIADLLDRFDEGEARGFWQTTHLLTVAPGSEHYRAELDSDITAMARWATLSDEVQKRVVDSAERYLRSHLCQPDQWLDKPEIRYFPAEAGYQAMVLLLRMAPERLPQLPAGAWSEWAPILANWSTGWVHGATWYDKVRLLEFAGPGARDWARSALLTFVAASVLSARRPSVENEAGYLWDDDIAATYLSLARAADAEPRAELVSTLAKHAFDRLRPLLLEWLDDRSDLGRLRLAAATLLKVDLERSWPVVKTALSTDMALAQEVLYDVSTIPGYERFPDHVPEAILADIYVWLRAMFPPASDPPFDDAHAERLRKEIGYWGEKLLATGLVGRGTPEAVDAIRLIVAALPTERWLGRILATTEAALRRKQWSPTPLPQLLQLAADRRSVLVNDAAALAAAVASALEDVQTRLTGATPESHYLWDSHTGRPKSEDEISDYLANELSRVLTTRGAVVNREVQIRRNRPSGIGERTDLLVDAAPLDGPAPSRLSVPVEVKGAWNDELRTAMRDQLVGRYMRDTATNDGIFVVTWPDLESWTDFTDKRRAALASLDREAVDAELAEQASGLAQQGARVRVVHLDIAYRRPS
jgi:hypothetical protein